MEPAKEGDAAGRGSLAAAGEPVFALVRRLVSRSARARAKGRCQAGALRRFFCGAGETDRIGDHRVYRVAAGRKVPVGDQPGKDASGGPPHSGTSAWDWAAPGPADSGSVRHAPNRQKRSSPADRKSTRLNSSHLG